MSPGPNSTGEPGPQPPFAQVTRAETLRQFLARRDRELTQQIDALHGQLLPKEQERAELRKAMAALGIESVDVPRNLLELVHAAPAVTDPLPPATPSATATIKHMTVSALRWHFYEGATPTELRDYMRAVFNREVDRNSISPQLARLRDQGVVEQLPLGGKWKLRPGGIAFDYPSSWPDMEKDEPTDPNAPNTRLADIT